MEYNVFGRTGMKVSDIGFGAWAIGGKGWGDGSSDRDAVEALKVSWEKGVNLYDTCDAYGDGHSEILIGEFLKGRREASVIVTKGGTNYRLPERSKNFNRDYLMMCLEESLGRLQTDYVDVYLLHVPDADWQDRAAVLETLKEMKQSGKVRFAGLAMWGAGDTMHALERDQDRVIDVLECPFNILNKSNLEVVKLAKERNIAVMTSQPLASGILTGKYREGARFAEGDNRRGFWSEERFEAVRPDMEIVEACTAETGLSMGHLALAYNMTYPGISCVIPGAKNAAQALDNAAATGLRLSSEIMERLSSTKGFVF